MSHHSSTTLDPTPAAHAHEHGHHGPKNPVRVYALTLAGLLFLTIVTVGVAQLDLGEANVLVAIAVATLKATLVALFFMHLLHDRPMNAIILCTALVMLGILLGFSFMDSDTRMNIIPQSGQYPAGAEFNRPEKLGSPFLGEKHSEKKPVVINEPPR